MAGRCCWGQVRVRCCFVVLQTKKHAIPGALLLWSLPLHLAVLIAGWGFTNFAPKDGDRGQPHYLQMRAKTAAAALDPRLVARLEGAR